METDVTCCDETMAKKERGWFYQVYMIILCSESCNTDGSSHVSAAREEHRHTLLLTVLRTTPIYMLLAELIDQCVTVWLTGHLSH